LAAKENSMDSRLRLFGRGIAAAIALIAAAPLAPLTAQDYPTRTIKMIVPYPAGGITDVLPRIMSEWLARKWGQTVVVENRTGAAGNIGAETVFKSEPDGYTLLVTAPSPLTVNKSLYAKLAFDPAEFVPVSILATIPSGLVVNPKVPYRNVAALIAHAKANPGKVNAATQGTGSTSHLTSEWIQQLTGIKFQLVPYRGSAPALQGLLGGEVDLMFDNLGSALPLAQQGQLRLLAVGTDRRMPSLPDTPTLSEAVPGLTSATWVGVFLPPKTSRAIADKLSTDFAEALEQPDIVKRFEAVACQPVGGTPQATAAFVKQEADRWKRVIADAGIKPQ
jgi:tripartite-type tricarboxylate transporter receptor subunit TctC